MEAKEEGRIDYDEAKDIAFAYLVLVNKLEQGKWVPNFVGRSDECFVNKMGGLMHKARPLRHTNGVEVEFFTPTSTHRTSFFTCDATTSTHVFTRV